MSFSVRTYGARGHLTPFNTKTFPYNSFFFQSAATGNRRKRKILYTQYMYHLHFTIHTHNWSVKDIHFRNSALKYTNIQIQHKTVHIHIDRQFNISR